MQGAQKRGKRPSAEAFLSAALLRGFQLKGCKEKHNRGLQGLGLGGFRACSGEKDIVLRIEQTITPTPPMKKRAWTRPGPEKPKALEHQTQ